MKIVCISGSDGKGGSAGVGKGEVAKILENYFDFIRVSFADEIKRTVRRWWPNFTIEELWGPSEARSRAHSEYGGLTVRRAAQFIGTEIGRELDGSVWVRLGLETARRLLEGGCSYSPTDGLLWSSSARKPDGVVFDDGRFANELTAVDAVGGYNWRVIRPGVAGLPGEAGQHASEHALDGYDDAKFKAIIFNNGSLGDLEDVVCKIARVTL